MKAQPTDQKEYDRVLEYVKARTARWPNAYASGQVVQEYKRRMAAKGKVPYKDSVPAAATGLRRWYKEKWVDIKTGQPCGAVHTGAYYPTCRPSIRVTSRSPVIMTELTPAQRAAMVLKKQKSKEKTVHYTETKPGAKAEPKCKRCIRNRTV